MTDILLAAPVSLGAAVPTGTGTHPCTIKPFRGDQVAQVGAPCLRARHAVTHGELLRDAALQVHAAPLAVVRISTMTARGSCCAKRRTWATRLPRASCTLNHAQPSQ